MSEQVPERVWIPPQSIRQYPSARLFRICRLDGDEIEYVPKAQLDTLEKLFRLQAASAVEAMDAQLDAAHDELGRVLADLNLAEQRLKSFEWQPIESAPKDSTWILGLLPTGRQAVVRWGGGTWEDDDRLCRDPFQWMPLPPAKD